jgi:DNA-directed RNA polymerase subunit RPC12/RpoP
MVEYICSVCKKPISGVLVERKIRCPYCSSKALEKKQDRVLEPIKAR